MATRIPSGALLVGMLAVAVAIASLPIVGSLRTRAEVRRTYDQAQALVSEGRYEAALARLDDALDGGRKRRPRLEELALLAASSRVDEIEAREGARAALSWLQDEIARKPYLEPLARTRLPRLEAAVERAR